MFRPGGGGLKARKLETLRYGATSTVGTVVAAFARGQRDIADGQDLSLSLISRPHAMDVICKVVRFLFSHIARRGACLLLKPVD